MAKANRKPRRLPGAPTPAEKNGEGTSNCVRETELGAFPADWKLVPLSEVASEAVNRNSRLELSRNDVLTVDNEEGLIPSDRKLGEDFTRYKLVRKKHFAYNPMRLNVGSIGLWERPEAAIVSPDYIVFRCHENQLLPEFLDQFRRCHLWRRQIQQSGQGSIRIRYYFRHIAAFRVPLPPVSEQRAIARTLRTLERAKKATRMVISALQQMKKSAMRHMFTYGPVPLDQADKVLLRETQMGPIPEHWEFDTLGGILQEPLRNGHSAKATGTEQGTRTLTLTAVTQDDFSIKNTKLTSADPERVRGMWLKSGDILIERANTPEYVGLAALYEGPEDYAIYPDLMVRVRVRHNRMTPKVLAGYLLTEPCRAYFRTNAKATAGNFPKIDQGVIEATSVPVPPLVEQERIENALRSIDRKIKAEIGRLRSLNSLYQTLLHHLVTGKVRVQDLPLPETAGGI